MTKIMTMPEHIIPLSYVEKKSSLVLYYHHHPLHFYPIVVALISAHCLGCVVVTGPINCPCSHPPKQTQTSLLGIDRGGPAIP